MIIPGVGLLSFILCIFINVYEEPLDMSHFEDNGEVSNVSVNKVQAAGVTELVEQKMTRLISLKLKSDNNF